MSLLVIVHTIQSGYFNRWYALIYIVYCAIRVRAIVNAANLMTHNGLHKNRSDSGHSELQTLYTSVEKTI